MQVLIAFALIILGLFLGAPVMYAFAAGALYLIFINGMDPSFLFSYGYASINSTVLLVIPMFIIAGCLIEKGNIGAALVNFVSRFVGRIKAGLAMVSVATCALFGAISGSGAATLTCIGSVMAPRLKEKGYAPGHVGALFACSAPLGLLIPPSAIQIVFAWTTGSSVLGCFLAIVGPGILLTILLCITNYFMLRNNNTIQIEEKQSKQVWRAETWKATKHGFPALLLPVLILGTIYGGYLTVTESAVAGVVYSLILGLFVYKGLNKKNFKTTILAAGSSTGSLMCLFLLMFVLSQVLIRMGLPAMICDFMLSISDNRIVILLMVNIFLILLGMMMDDTSCTLLCAPMLLPLMHSIGVSPLQFAAIIGVNVGLANITPPAAPFLYMSCRVCGCSFKDELKPTLIMIICAWVPTLLLTTWIPKLSTWLPSICGY